MNDLTSELQRNWNEWDALIPRGEAAPQDRQSRVRVRDQMVDLLNRRSYIRNLLRDVNEALTSN
jgi:molecular chaperone HscB